MKLTVQPQRESEMKCHCGHAFEEIAIENDKGYFEHSLQCWHCFNSIPLTLSNPSAKGTGPLLGILNNTGKPVENQR